jgi:flagellum-specific peptidoglycan hydrolase FlgJ
MKFKFLISIAIATLVLTSCGSKKSVVRSKQKPVISIKNLPSVKQDAHVRKLKRNRSNLNKYTLAYIKKYAPLAVREMHVYKIPASITLAQGILESGNGRSGLASKSKNHFGIKCHRGWKGARVYHDDDEKGECFRKYAYVENSYSDHSKFLYGRKRYAFLFKLNKMKYKSWAKGLKKAGYATDRKYPKKLIKIIEDYKLHEFDKIRKKELKKSKRRRTATQVSVVTSSKKKPKLKSGYHQVRKGDTLYSIARKYNIAVGDLKKMNGLKSNAISIGQRLRLK